MFTNKSNDGRNNVCGTVIEKRRKEMGKSQRQLADRSVPYDQAQCVGAAGKAGNDQ